VKETGRRLPRRRHRFKKDKAISSIARVNLNGGSIKSIDSGAKGIQGNPKGFKVVQFSFGQLLILAQNNGIFFIAHVNHSFDSKQGEYKKKVTERQSLNQTWAILHLLAL
jgi:hypothetical protein